MWNNGALFAETAQKLILGKYFFSVLSCTHNKLPSFLAMDRISELRVRFFGKIQIRILVSKNGFCVSLPKICVSLGDGSENSTSVKRSSMQIYWSRHIFSRSCVTKHSIVKKKIQVIIPFRIFEKFSPKVQTEALTRQDNFICLPFL